MIQFFKKIKAPQSFEQIIMFMEPDKSNVYTLIVLEKNRYIVFDGETPIFTHNLTSVFPSNIPLGLLAAWQKDYFECCANKKFKECPSLTPQVIHNSVKLKSVEGLHGCFTDHIKITREGTNFIIRQKDKQCVQEVALGILLYIKQDHSGKFCIGKVDKCNADFLFILGVIRDTHIYLQFNFRNDSILIVKNNNDSLGSFVPYIPMSLEFSEDSLAIQKTITLKIKSSLDYFFFRKFHKRNAKNLSSNNTERGF